MQETHRRSLLDQHPPSPSKGPPGDLTFPVGSWHLDHIAPSHELEAPLLNIPSYLWKVTLGGKAVHGSLHK